ncbi:Tom37 C-terminal domain-containing protein [Jimgerdemannia flammicorona]|uniref:Tom37 C-terminal domain-containing protein n=1 Tax=Jimgerdemannia flammicorona TaxID=994334 RepID=A0A433QVR2_9FUNG|nr:Tom37 C-terminal domain-containing protein [Jimgerdemannia flammicorona]
MAYLQLIGASFNVVESNDPNISPTGELPLLKDGPAWIGGANRILVHLAKKGMDGNENLTPEQKAQYFAYASLVEDKLYDCMLFTWYADTTNFVKTIRPTYAKLLPFPTRYIVPSQLRKAAKFRLEEYGVEVTEDDAVVSQATEERKFLLETWHKMYTVARTGYHSLSIRLGNKKYFFGDKPTTLDCLVFAHLSLHIYKSTPHHRLHTILVTDYQSLLQHTDRMRKRFFATPLTRGEASSNLPSPWAALWRDPVGWFRGVRAEIRGETDQNTKEKLHKSEQQIDFERKRVWAVAGAVVVVIAYVFVNGIVRIVKEDDEYADAREREREVEVELE